MALVSINRLPVVLSYLDPRLATGTVPGTKIKLRTRRYALPLFLALAAEYNATVAPLRKGECWGWNARKARGANAWSDHASGTAIDLNSAHEGAQGPRGGMARMSPEQIKASAAIKRKFRVVIWGGDKAHGGDYAQPQNWDPMHYAIRPGVTKADVLGVITALRINKDGTIKPLPAPKPVPVPKPQPKPVPKPTAPKHELKIVKLDRGVKPGRRHAQVRKLQLLLIKAGYGPIKGAPSTLYGDDTQAAVIRFHNRNPKFKSGITRRDTAIGSKGFEELQRQAARKK